MYLLKQEAALYVAAPHTVAAASTPLTSSLSSSTAAADEYDADAAVTARQ